MNSEWAYLLRRDQGLMPALSQKLGELKLARAVALPPPPLPADQDPRQKVLDPAIDRVVSRRRQCTFQIAGDLASQLLFL
jgi:hypothetical protein